MFWSRWQKRQRWRNRRVGVVVSLLYVSLLGGSRTKAQSPRDTQLQTFTLEEAAAFALKNYPAVCASLERVRAAEAGVGVARTTEATFVVRIRNGSPEWVNARTRSTESSSRFSATSVRETKSPCGEPMNCGLGLT